MYPSPHLCQLRLEAPLAALEFELWDVLQLYLEKERLGFLWKVLGCTLRVAVQSWNPFCRDNSSEVKRSVDKSRVPGARRL